MYVLIVIVLVIMAILISNFLVKIKEEDQNKVEENKSMKLKDFLLAVREMDPEVELSFLLGYYFDSSLSDEDIEKIRLRLIAFTTNYSYYAVKKMVDLQKMKIDNQEKIEFLENLVIENGFPSVSGLSEVYVENVEVLETRNYITSIIIKFKRISIIKFIQFVESDLMESQQEYILEDKKILQNVLKEIEGK